MPQQVSMLVRAPANLYIKIGDADVRVIGATDTASYSNIIRTTHLFTNVFTDGVGSHDLLFDDVTSSGDPGLRPERD